MKIYSKETLSKNLAHPKFVDGFKLSEHLRLREVAGHTEAEFIGTDNFQSEWYTRQQYEIDAGRLEEPILYTPFYNVLEDSSFPRNVNVLRMGPGGVVFQKVEEGGETKFATVGQSSYTVPIYHYSTGVEYSKDLVLFNELWNLGLMEREAGVAFNALLNDVHISPILNYSYAAANQTAASSAGDTLLENIMLTIEDAVTNASGDQTNPRRGPYVLLCATANLISLRKALTPVPQLGFTMQDNVVMDSIQSIVAYNGWSGTMAKKTVSYTGVSTNKAYLIDLSYRSRNFVSLIKQPLQATRGNEDISRFILEQVVWDAYFGAYADPIAAVEEITLPTS